MRSMREALDRLAFAADDRRDLLASEPTSEQRAVIELRRRSLEEWPFDEQSPWLNVWTFLAALPDARELHAVRDVPDDVSWATLSDLGRHTAIGRTLYGSGGLRDSRWLTRHFSGQIYELGRLQFECSSESELGIHIPATGPLAPEACDASFARAASLFDTRDAVCTSWLLDPQLAEHLPASSNIVRFQRRFELEDEGGEADADVLRFVFSTLDSDLDQLSQRTTLERALIAHMRDGGHWRAPTGRLAIT
jgi:GNAT-like C-terminal domain/N-acyltransferase N-terminal domain